MSTALILVPLQEVVMDIVYFGIMIVLFVVSWLFVKLAERV